MINVTLKDFGPEANWQSFDFGRSNQIETALPYQPKQAVLLRILLGHDFVIGKSRFWLAERAKYRGSHGGAPETGFKKQVVGGLFKKTCSDPLRMCADCRDESAPAAST